MDLRREHKILAEELALLPGPRVVFPWENRRLIYGAMLAQVVACAKARGVRHTTCQSWMNWKITHP